MVATRHNSRLRRRRGFFDDEGYARAKAPVPGEAQAGRSQHKNLRHGEAATRLALFMMASARLPIVSAGRGRKAFRLT